MILEAIGGSLMKKMKKIMMLATVAQVERKFLNIFLSFILQILISFGIS